ncbi:histidine acid phosphatase [Hypomontagnella submonticulosa]|nr:histidine acid phosphatase [Hypomontagnella submonticulosa]
MGGYLCMRGLVFNLLYASSSYRLNIVLSFKLPTTLCMGVCRSSPVGNRSLRIPHYRLLWRTLLVQKSPTISATQCGQGCSDFIHSFSRHVADGRRYPDLYRDGDEFVVWANNYTRVLQTASMFVRGFLGFAASQKGSIVSVTSRGFPAGVGDSLAPSDMCPKFNDAEGGDYKSTWDDIWIPPVLKRLQALIRGNLTLTANDVNQIPYLCGFETHITGRLSPWCNVLNDEELKRYEYSNDLRYYYGVGPGTDLPKKMMTPFLNALVGILHSGPTTGTKADGSPFEVPKLLFSFLNDGQLTELVTASGVFDAQPLLSATKKDDHRLWIGSRYVSMRGTIAFERLNCLVKRSTTTTFNSSRPAMNETYIRIRLNDAVYPVPSCKDGPGLTCKLSDYAQYIADKYASEGDWITNCNVTVVDDTPTKVKGASFFTDLSKPWVTQVAA